MREILRQTTKVPGVRGTVVIGEDGFVIASELSGGEDPQAIAALLSRVWTSVEGAFGRLEQGQPQRMILSGSSETVVIHSLGEALLVALVRRDANMGMVLVEVKGAVKKLSDTLAGDG
jgi:uncharacterized protein